MAFAPLCGDPIAAFNVKTPLQHFCSRLWWATLNSSIGRNGCLKAGSRPLPRFTHSAAAPQRHAVRLFRPSPSTHLVTGRAEQQQPPRALRRRTSGAAAPAIRAAGHDFGAVYPASQTKGPSQPWGRMGVGSSSFGRHPGGRAKNRAAPETVPVRLQIFPESSTIDRLDD